MILNQQTSGSDIANASPGDGTYAGARKLYLARALTLTLLERLRAVEEMAEAAALVRNASINARKPAQNPDSI